MPSGISKTRRHRASRRKNSQVNVPQPTAPIQVVEGEADGSVLTLRFNQAVGMKKLPQYTTDVVGATPVSGAMPDPLTLELTFSASIAAATQVNIPYEEPGIRNAGGGFVATSMFPLAA